MTRQEFIDNVDNMNELLEVCIEAGREELFDGYYSCEEYDDRVTNEIYDEIREYGWADAVRYAYDDLPGGYSWYLCPPGEGWDCYRGVDDYEFRELKSYVQEQLENDGWFDEEVEDEEVEDNATPFEPYEEPDDRPDFGDDFDLMAFASGSDELLESIKDEELAREAANADTPDSNILSGFYTTTSNSSSITGAWSPITASTSDSVIINGQTYVATSTASSLTF